MFGTTFLLPLYFRTGRGMSAWEAGLLLAPQGLGAAAGSVLVNRTISKVAPRTLVVTGIVLILAGTAPFTQLGHDLPDAVIAATLAVRGVGMAMVGAPVMNIVCSRIEPGHLPKSAYASNSPARRFQSLTTLLTRASRGAGDRREGDPRR